MSIECATRSGATPMIYLCGAYAWHARTLAEPVRSSPQDIRCSCVCVCVFVECGCLLKSCESKSHVKCVYLGWNTYVFLGLDARTAEHIHWRYRTHSSLHLNERGQHLAEPKQLNTLPFRSHSVANIFFHRNGNVKLENSVILATNKLVLRHQTPRTLRMCTP